MALIRSVTLFSLLLVTLFTVSCAQNAMTNTYLFEGIGISKNQSNEAYIFSYVLYDSKDENDQVKTLLPRNIARLNLTGVSEKTLVHRFSSVYIPVRYPTKRSIFSILPRYYYMQLNRQYENQVNQSFISTSIMVHDTLKKRTYRILFTHTNIYDLILVNEQNTYKLKWITPSLNKSICALMMREVNWFSLIERMNATSEDNEDETYEDLYTQHCLEHDRSRSFVPSNNNYTLTTLKAGQIFSFALSYKLVKVYAWRRNFNDVYIETGWSGKFFQVPRLNCYKPEGSFVRDDTEWRYHKDHNNTNHLSGKCARRYQSCDILQVQPVRFVGWAIVSSRHTNTTDLEQGDLFSRERSRRDSGTFCQPRSFGGIS